MQRLPLGSALALLLAGASASVLPLAPRDAIAQQVPDTTFDTRVARPALVERAPRMLFDEAHHEFHRIAGRYRPFAGLARGDGWRVTANAAAIDSAVLATGDLLVVANALGDEDMDTPEAANPAFTPSEIAAVELWVRNGGALLLIADHAPMGDAARSLGNAFGVDMLAAFTTDKAREEGDHQTILHFRTGKGLFDSHPIMLGRDSTERVRHVHTFTGQSLAGPPGAVQLLTLSDKAQDILPGPSRKKQPAGGRAQGIAFEHGRGRVVVLGEAAMMTAQIAGGSHPMGMNVPGSDDRQFALNILRWLARVL